MSHCCAAIGHGNEVEVLEMTELEKKAIYDKEYAKSLEWHKNRFNNYEHYLRIPLKERWEIHEHFKRIFAIMKKCGVCRFEGEEPMSNVSNFLVKFNKEGDSNFLDDLLISNQNSCWTSVMFEQTEFEIENAARRSAQIEVDMAEIREKRAAEEAEQIRKEQEEQKARQKAEEEHRAKCEQDVADFKAKLEAKQKEMRIWRENVINSLEDIRKGNRHWYATDELTNAELAAVKKYANTLVAFTDAQNMGLTGIGLYAQNEARANAHEEMLDVFDLHNSEFAKEITKTYDFSDDFDYNMNMYVHLPDHKIVNMLGFALLEARKKENEHKENCNDK